MATFFHGDEGPVSPESLLPSLPGEASVPTAPSAPESPLAVPESPGPVLESALGEPSLPVVASPPEKPESSPPPESEGSALPGAVEPQPPIPAERASTQGTKDFMGSVALQ